MSNDRLISDEARPPHLAASFISWNIWKVGTNRLEPKETAQRSGPHWGRGRLVGRVEVPKMEYRGKHCTIVQGIGPDSWKWTVRLDEKDVMAKPKHGLLQRPGSSG